MLRLLLLCLPLLSSVAAAEGAAMQDLRCNGIEVQAELPVDLGDPLCASTLNQLGNPLPNGDYYLGYEWFGCGYPLVETADGRGQDVDPDGDALGGLPDPISFDEPAAISMRLECDNCPLVANVDQADGGQDGIGDVCDGGPELRSGSSRCSTGTAGGGLPLVLLSLFALGLRRRD
jgi:MYXO-CTERM domain-containing protein